MPDQDPGPIPREEPGVPSTTELVARLQGLIDAKPSERGYSLEWTVPAYFLGDLSALSTLSLRSTG